MSVFIVLTTVFFSLLFYATRYFCLRCLSYKYTLNVFFFHFCRSFSFDSSIECACFVVWLCRARDGVEKLVFINFFFFAALFLLSKQLNTLSYITSAAHDQHLSISYGIKKLKRCSCKATKKHQQWSLVKPMWRWFSNQKRQILMYDDAIPLLDAYQNNNKPINI